LVPSYFQASLKVDTFVYNFVSAPSKLLVKAFESAFRGNFGNFLVVLRLFLLVCFIFSFYTIIAILLAALVVVLLRLG